MDATHGYEYDTSLEPSHSVMASMAYQEPSASASGSVQSQLEQSEHEEGQTHPTGQTKFSNGTQIRSRVTVVCAECKRLKLKCDRRTPCGACLKRDTTNRCIYSQAAVEKVDVQSLHNRLMNVEGHLEQMTSGSPAQFKAPFSSHAASTPSGMNATPAPGFMAPAAAPSAPPLDRALLATGASGSSVVINLEDVASIWLSELEELGIDPRMRVAGSHDPSSSTRAATASGSRIKKEPSPGALPPVSTAYTISGSSVPYTSEPYIPPLPLEVFCAQPAHSVLPAPQAPLQSAEPHVTPALLGYLPPPAARPRMLRALEDTMLLHPCFNVKHFVQRVDAMFAWGDAAGPAHNISGGSSGPQAAHDGRAGKQHLTELARDIFNQPAGGKKAGARAQAKPQPQPTLSFFAAASAALALGALVAGSAPEEAERRCAPAALHALSEQALALAERTAPYDVDAVVAMILQVLYLLHDGRMSVAQGVFPLVGKMINVARMMGLAVDPDDFSGGLYSLFEAETRRRVWWDVFYYDLFVSDCMGHPPTIADNTFTTRLPAEVDDDQFNPSSTTLPSPPGGEGSEKGTAYFVLKCRLAQLVKNVKKQTFRDPLDDDPGELSMEQAATYESSVITFLNKLPEAFRLDMNSDAAQLTSASFSVSPFLVAQRCELVILAHRVILKLYLPFLKEASLNKPHQAFFGTINAAHAIIYASRVMHLIWQDTRPAAFDFYDFSRTLFDAAVVCAHAVIQQPKNMLAGEAMKSVGFAADILRQLGAACSGVEGSRGERSKTEAIRIVEIMKNKAETARTRNANGAAVGVKRKHSEVESEGERLSGDFRLPFVGAAVASRAEPTKSVPHSKAAPAKDTPPQEPKPRNDNKRLKEKDDKREKDKSKEKDKDKEKDKTKYPSVGIRIRPGHVPPAIRQRGSSTATSVSSGSVPSGRINSSTPGVGPTAAPSHTQAPAAQPPAPTVPPPPHTSTYTDFLPPQPQRHGSSSGFEPVHSNDYPVQYSAPDDSLDRRRYSSQPYAEAPQAPVYAQQAPSTSYPPSSAHSPTAYTNGPSPSNYYIYTSPAPSSGYDSSGALSHSHSMSMAEAVAPSPITTGSTRGSMGPPMSTPSHDQPYPYNAPAGKDLGVSPQTGHEFQQAAPALALPSPHMQQWQSTEQASAYANWPEYTKYYSG